MEDQKKKDKTTFYGLFDRGDLGYSESPAGSTHGTEEGMTVAEALRRLDEGEKEVERLRADDLMEEAAILEARLQSSRKDLDEFVQSKTKERNRDDDDKSSEHMSEAVQSGLDLKDEK